MREREKQPVAALLSYVGFAMKLVETGKRILVLCLIYSQNANIPALSWMAKAS